MRLIKLAVNGILMRGLELENNLLRVRAKFIKEAKTEKCYRLWSIRDRYPAMLRVSSNDKMAVQVDVEVWELPYEGLTEIFLSEPDGLSIGKVALEDGEIILTVLYRKTGDRIMEWKDGKTRCKWANPNNDRYLHYHDEEWGVPVYDDHKLFEMLILECFQAGLSWECVLNKQEAFRQAFDDFDLEKVCSYDDKKIAELCENPGIIRNRLKIRAAISNARVFRDIKKEFGSFSTYLWHWTEKKVIYENDVVSSPLSDRVSKDLQKRGMKFVGTVIIYSYMQAVGVIYSHEKGCFMEHKGKTKI